MRTIKAQPLTKEEFRKYGEFQNLLDNEDLAKASVNSAGFFCDVMQLNFGTTTLPSVNVCNVKKVDKKVIKFVEAHQYTAEGLLPLDCDVIIYVGTMPRGEFSGETLKAFIVPKGTFVKLNPLIAHGTQYTIDTDEAHILCMLPQRTFKNDCIKTLLSDEDAVVVEI